jgi:NADH-quinone oxidoreductase subunit H
MIFFFLILFLKVLSIIIPLLLSVAYFTLIERKVLAVLQRRKGPNVIGLYGMLQPLSDGLKLFAKEALIPSNANKFLFSLGPILAFSISLLPWIVIPFSKYGAYAEINITILYTFAISSLGVYGIIISGWSSNSKYAFLGALRSTSQMISYELSLGFCLITIALCTGSFSFYSVINAQQNLWFCIPFLPLFLIFFIAALAETNRHPFDLPEAEAELVSGYNVEYAGMGFALFSLAEYSNMLQMSALNSILFLGGWLPITTLFIIPTQIWFSLKICIFVLLFIIMRAALPRYRYDQLMNLGWKVFLPITLVYTLLTLLIITSFNFFPA